MRPLEIFPINTHFIHNYLLSVLSQSYCGRTLFSSKKEAVMSYIQQTKVTLKLYSLIKGTIQELEENPGDFINIDQFSSFIPFILRTRKEALGSLNHQTRFSQPLQVEDLSHGVQKIFIEKGN